ncbi:fibrinogen-binding protein [Ensifer sp. 4252]|uniref:fibrinogen-binding protein n=1 Tax=Ensifer sp. 4252 TaxID=3373915 RepID=UPI003D1B6B45
MSALLDDSIKADDDLKVGALADGLATSAANDLDVDDGSTSNVGIGNGNHSTDNSQDNDTKTDVDVDVDTDIKTEANENGDNRNNYTDSSTDYDYDYDYKDNSKVETDIDQKNNGDNRDNSYEWDYDSKVTTKTDIDTDIDTDIKTEANENGDNRNNYSSSDNDIINKSDDDFATLKDVKDFDNLGIAGGDLTFNIGDDFSFNLNVDHILNNSLEGAGNDTGFSVVQANNLADQDAAYDFRMNNSDANNDLRADGGHSDGGDGLNFDTKSDWDLEAGDGINGSTTSDASAILANSGFHQEIVQGANLVSNAVDSSVIGGNSHTTDVGHDTDS